VPIIVGSVAHTSAVNRRIEAHFENLSFTVKLTKAQSDCDGLFLFQAARWDQKTGNLTRKVTSTEEQTGNQLSYKFTLATVNLR
jgi:hypothetical protein